MTARNIDPRIRANIQKIRDFTFKDDVLRNSSHHFLYDKRYSDAASIQYVVIGINPGEPPSDPNRRADVPLEETSEFDFLKEGVETPSAKKWKNNCAFVCQTLDVALTEALLWSSHTLAELDRRYGSGKRRYLEFSAQLNEELIAIHKPRAVIFVGAAVKLVAEIAQMYRLSPAGEILYSQKKTRLDRIIVPYVSGEGLPWIFVKHWSNRPSSREKEMMRDYVATHT